MRALQSTFPVVVTGGTSGIGFACVRELATLGLQVVALSRSRGELDHLESGAKSLIQWSSCDLTDVQDVAQVFHDIEQRFGGVSALVCSAGVTAFGSVEDQPQRLMRQQFEVNYFGAVACVQAALPMLRRVPRGRVVFVGSLAASAPIPYQVQYSATKAALRALAIGLSVELVRSGVTVSLFEPGDVRTGILRRAAHVSASDVYRHDADSVQRQAEKMMESAPAADRAGRALAKIVVARRPARVRGFGPQTLLVRGSVRLLPEGVAWTALRRYWGLKRRRGTAGSARTWP